MYAAQRSADIDNMAPWHLSHLQQEKRPAGEFPIVGDSRLSVAQSLCRSMSVKPKGQGCRQSRLAVSGRAVLCCRMAYMAGYGTVFLLRNIPGSLSVAPVVLHECSTAWECVPATSHAHLSANGYTRLR